jgi:hypothetical protein
MMNVAHMVLPRTFAVYHLGSLDDVMGVDVRMSLDGFQGKSMVLPCSQVIGAVH